jgi:hypothetical protein
MTEINEFAGFEDLLEHDWAGVVEEMEKAEAVVSEVDALLTEMIEQVEMKIAEAEVRLVAINVEAVVETVDVVPSPLCGKSTSASDVLVDLLSEYEGTDPLALMLRDELNPGLSLLAEVVDLTHEEELRVVGKKRVYDLIDLTGDD